MRFIIDCLQRDTGQPHQMYVEADSEADAIAQAADAGYVVESIQPIEQRPTPEPRSFPPTSQKPNKQLAVVTPWLLGTQVVIIVILTLGLGVPLIQLLEPSTQPTQQWEYMITSPPDDTFDLQMKRLGENGWELVFARRATSGSSSFATASYEIILKRPKK